MLRRLVLALTLALGIAVSFPAGAHAVVSDESDFTVGVRGDVFDIGAAANGRSIIAGSFDRIGAESRDGLGALLGSGYADKDFNPSLPEGAKVNALAMSADRSIVYVGGEFDAINGVPRANLAALDAVTGEVIMDWQADANGEVRDIQVAGDRIYVAGHFWRVNDIFVPKLAAVTLGGDTITSFQPRPGWTVREIRVSSDLTTVYAIGAFTHIGGADRSSGVGAVDAATGASTAFDPVVASGAPTAIGLSPDGSYFFVAVASNVLHAFRPAVSNTEVWSVKTSGDTQAVAVSESGIVYIGGHFNKIDRGDKVETTASLHLADGSLTDWRPTVRGSMGPWVIELEADRVLIGGDLNQAGGRRTGGFARFSGTP